MNSIVLVVEDEPAIQELVAVNLEHSGYRVWRAGGIVVSMLRKALDAFARLDEVAAAEVIRDDAAIDEAFRGIMRQLITFMMEDPRTISTALEIAWVARALERMGDHSKNMAEQVIYIVKGTDVRHTTFEDIERKTSQ